MKTTYDGHDYHLTISYDHSKGQDIVRIADHNDEELAVAHIDYNLETAWFEDAEGGTLSFWEVEGQVGEAPDEPDELMEHVLRCYIAGQD